MPTKTYEELMVEAYHAAISEQWVNFGSNPSITITNNGLNMLNARVHNGQIQVKGSDDKWVSPGHVQIIRNRK